MRLLTDTLSWFYTKRHPFERDSIYIHSYTTTCTGLVPRAVNDEASLIIRYAVVPPRLVQLVVV